MKNAIFYIFAAVLGVVGLSACGGGGGGGISAQTPIFSLRALNAEERTALTSRVSVRYLPVEFGETEIHEDWAEYVTGLGSINLTISPNQSPNPYSPGTASTCAAAGPTGGEPCHDTVVLNPGPGMFGVIEAISQEAVTLTSGGTVILPVGHTITLTLAVFQQGATNYLAFVCDQALPSGNTPLDHEHICLNDDNSVYKFNKRTFQLPSMEYTITGTAVFRFADGLIGEDALNYRGLYFTEEHAEFRHPLNEYLTVNSGYRRFSETNTGLMYTGVNFAYDNWRLQYRMGDVQSDYYKDEIIQGAAFGWQGENFAAKAEKPFGGGDKAWFRLFYQRELK